MRVRTALIGIVILYLPLIGMAQKVLKISGEYIYHAPKTVSPVTAEQTAVERARLQALSDAFGTRIRDITTTVMKSTEEGSDVDLQKFVESEVKGEWLSDEKPPKVEFVGFDADMMVYKAKVWGLAREIVTSPVAIQVRILKNGIDARYESTDFTEGDEIALSFKTPVNGFVAVYMVDDQEKVYQLLPYRRDSRPCFPVEGGSDYLFFSTKAPAERGGNLADEYVLAVETDLAYHYVFTIFSPHDFMKAEADDPGSVSQPAGLSMERFQKWLSACRIKDPQMVVDRQTVSIRKKL